MPYLDDLPENAGPPAVFKKFPDVYGPFSDMSQALMNGPSPLSPAERGRGFFFLPQPYRQPYFTPARAAPRTASRLVRGTRAGS